MTAIRHDRKGNVVKLNEALYKRELRLFDVAELREEAERLLRPINYRTYDWRYVQKIRNRIIDVIAEKELAEKADRECIRRIARTADKYAKERS